MKHWTHMPKCFLDIDLNFLFVVLLSIGVDFVFVVQNFVELIDILKKHLQSSECVWYKNKTVRRPFKKHNGQYGWIWLTLERWIGNAVSLAVAY